MSKQQKELQNLPHFEVIDSNQQLVKACQQLSQKDAIALDTEFVRERTYFPKLGLIQLYGGENVYLIDPLKLDDFSPFIDLLKNKNVIKVLHSCSEDLDVFQHYFKQMPRPIFDTQIATAFLGLGQSMGLANLLKYYFSIDIDKGATRTNWLKRPLSQFQLNYAAADVWYLLPLYQRIMQDLLQTPWKRAVDFDSQLMIEKKLTIQNPDTAYLSISNAWRLDQAALMRLKLLAKWRFEQAIKCNLPLNFVVREANLWKVANENPTHTSTLLELGFSVQEVRRYGKKILQLLHQATNCDEKYFPPLVINVSKLPYFSKIECKLHQKLKELCPKNLNHELLASRRSLNNFIKWILIKQEDPNFLPDLLRDWRKPYGLKLLDYFHALKQELEECH